MDPGFPNPTTKTIHFTVEGPEVTVDIEDVTCCPGCSYPLQIELTNNGNCPEDYEWELTGNGPALDPATPFSQSQGTVTVPANSTVYLHPHVNTNPNAERGDTASVTITLTTTDDCPADTKTATATVTIGRPDLVIGGVGEDDEEDPGVFVVLNDDDDDDNGVADLEQDEPGERPVPGENDLIPLTMSAGGLPDCGRLTLSVGENPPCGNITLWTTAQKDAQPASLDWDLSAGAPPTLYVEGIGTSCGPRDLTFTLTYSNDDCDPPQCSCSDVVKLTVVDVDISLNGVPETLEESEGAYLCLNDDDDDVDGVLDKDDTGTVNNENDLVSFTLSRGPGLERGTMKLETSGAAKIKVWENATKGTEVPLPKTWDLTTQTPPATLYVEGVDSSDAERDIELKLSWYDGSRFSCQDIVKITVLEVIRVEWVATPTTSLDANPNPGGGLRVYPGKTSPTDPECPHIVKVQAELKPAVSGRTIYFSSLDVDDPSANTAPIDDEASGQDNRGTPRQGTVSPTSAPTNGVGVAEVTFTPLMQPGDNFRVAAECDAGRLTTLQAPQNVPDGRVLYAAGSVVPEGVRITPMLTVWRRLWVERDTMSAPALHETQVLGTVDSIARNVPVAGQSTVDLGQNLPDELSDLNLFEEGTIVFLACPGGANTFGVCESTSNSVTDDEVIILGVPGTCANGSDYLLSDDDNLAVLPHYPSGGPLLTAAYAQAYILPLYLGAEYQDIVGFDMHLGAWDIEYGWGTWDDGKDLSSSACFWSCFVAGCWEFTEDEDGDPDYCFSLTPPFVARPGAEVPTTGVTDGDSGKAAIFMQALTDTAACTAGTDEAHTVVHEIGHTCGSHDQHVPSSIMEEGAPTGENSFAPESIAIFRSQVIW